MDGLELHVGGFCVCTSEMAETQMETHFGAIVRVLNGNGPSSYIIQQAHAYTYIDIYSIAVREH